MMYDQILKANVRGKVCQTVRKSLAFVLSVHDIFFFYSLDEICMTS